MAKIDRCGKRKSRDERAKRIPELGYYIIVTDTTETERNYFEGLRDSLPITLQRKLVIKVVEKNTKDLVESARSLAAENPIYGNVWIVFDRDRVPDFDDIIDMSQKTELSVGWSNPCIEVWFHAYFGSMPNYSGEVPSQECWKRFGTEYKKRTGKTYSKDDDSIYNMLNKYGNEPNAICIAAKRYNDKVNINSKPSQMESCTTLFKLIYEIKKKVDSENNH